VKTAEVLFKEQQEAVMKVRQYGEAVRTGLEKLSVEYKQSRNYKIILDSIEVFEYRVTKPSWDALDQA
jgi:hypothetical protein